MDDIQQRQEAIRLYLAKEKAAAIVHRFNKSRKWLYHWISRYKNNPQGNWWEEQSRAPHTPCASVDAAMEQNILLIRTELMQEKMAQIGAISIQYEMQRRAMPVAPVWTINRVIAKHGLNKPLEQKMPGKAYPETFWHTHQMDLVGPRYIKGDGMFYSINLIDITTHTCYVKAVRTKSSVGIVAALAAFWQTYGMPDALQMDNELAFRGSNRYPRSFGSVVRFALSQGVAPIFIPVKEPWRNGIIEKFNDTYQKRFLRAYTFENLNDLSVQEKAFITFHNSHHRYSSQQHKTPDEMQALALKPICYKGNIHLPNMDGKVHIPLRGGCVYYIRYIRSDLKLRLPNECFILHERFKYSYVVAEVNIENHCLNIRQNYEIVQTFPYTITAIDW